MENKYVIKITWKLFSFILFILIIGVPQWGEEKQTFGSQDSLLCVYVFFKD